MWVMCQIWAENLKRGNQLERDFTPISSGYFQHEQWKIEIMELIKTVTNFT